MGIRISILAALSFVLVTEAKAKESQPVEALFIGDSHSTMSFGVKLAERLNKEYSGSYAGYAYSGDTAQQYVEDRAGLRKTTSGYCKYGVVAKGKPFICEDGVHITPKMSDLIELHKPKRIIIELGTNYLGRSESFLKSTVTRLLEEIKKQNPQAECYWVGPPDTGKPDRPSGLDLSKLIAKLSELVQGTCPFIDSGPPYTNFPKDWRQAKRPDSLHFKGEKGREQVNRWVSRVNSVLFPTYQPIDPYPELDHPKGEDAL